MKLYKHSSRLGIWITADKAGKVPHNPKGPAFTSYDKRTIAYWINGKRHRIGGPALILGSEDSYWINGKYYCDKKEYKKDSLPLKGIPIENVIDTINISNI
jgi:hypothetical protein